jgi:hypothetical protein
MLLDMGGRGPRRGAMSCTVKGSVESICQPSVVPATAAATSWRSKVAEPVS